MNDGDDKPATDKCARPCWTPNFQTIGASSFSFGGQGGTTLTPPSAIARAVELGAAGGQSREFQSKFHRHLDELDIRHVYIKPRTPRLNGKVERSHRVDNQEFYQLLDKRGISDDIRLFNDKLREWENYYNFNRPHGALNGQTPYERLLAKKKAGTSPAS
jgi:hypothetical protein